jgi:plastocyanin
LAVGEVSAKIGVAVVPGDIDTVMVEPAMITLKAGDQQAFSAAGFDTQGNRLNIEPVWSVNGDIGKIGADGVFQSTTVGPGFVLVRMDSATGVAEITVEPGPAERIAVFPEHVEMKAGDTARFTATVYDAFGNVTPGELKWSLSGGSMLGTLSSDAEFNAQKIGQGHIVASLDAVSGRASLKVLPGTLTEVIAKAEEIMLASGRQSEIETYGLDGFGNRVPIEPSFQIIPKNLGRIEPKKNLFTALKMGAGLIKASVGEASG